MIFKAPGTSMDSTSITKEMFIRKERASRTEKLIKTKTQIKSLIKIYPTLVSDRTFFHNFLSFEIFADFILENSEVNE